MNEVPFPTTPSRLSRLSRFARGRRGAVMVEYSFVLAFVAIVFGSALILSFSKMRVGYHDMVLSILRPSP